MTPARARRGAALFFYGTLLDVETRRLVLGKAADALMLTPASLAGYRRCAVRGATVPILVRRKGARVEGLICRGLDRGAMARLDHFEGAGYRLVAVEPRLEDGAACRAFAYLGASRLASGRRSWRLEDWRRRHGRAFRRTMRRWMAGYRAGAYLGCIPLRSRGARQSRED